MPAFRRRWSPANVRALIDATRAWPRYELLGGELFVTPAPGNQHQLLVSEIHRLVGDYTESQQVGVAFVSPADLELEQGSVTQPDVFVVPAASATPSEGWETVKTLLLVVEVLSPSSVRTDRVVKRDYYLEAGIPEYWVVDAEARVIECWTPAQETPHVARDHLVWQPANATGPLTVDIPEMFDRVDRLLTLAGFR